MNKVEFAPEFRDWFGQSRMVDDDGQPLIVHHFTYFEFEEFDRLWGAKYFGRDPEGVDTVGLWFTDNAQARYVEPGQGRRMDVYLSIQRPFYIDDVQQGDAFDQLRAMVAQAGGSSALRARLKAQGYDGIVLNGTQLDSVRQNAILAFEPEQILSVDKARTLALDPASVAQASAAERFAAWFGRSLLVDEAGRPREVYHGTDRALQMFAPSQEGNLGAGYYVTASATAAGKFAERATVERRGGGANILPLYVKVERWLNLDVLTDEDLARLREAIPRKPEGLAAFGYDPGMIQQAYEFIQRDLDELHVQLDRKGFEASRLSRMLEGQDNTVEVLRRFYAAAGYDAVARTSNAMVTIEPYFEIVVFDAANLRSAIEVRGELAGQATLAVAGVPEQILSVDKALTLSAEPLRVTPDALPVEAAASPTISDAPASAVDSARATRGALTEAVAKKYAPASATVDGRTVGEDVPNTGSIAATLDDYVVLPELREIPMSAFDQLGELNFATADERTRTERLAQAIGASGRVAPLIVVEDEEGPYILEGGHRFDALRLLGATAFPAKVVLDMASLEAGGVHPLPTLPSAAEAAPRIFYGTIAAKESDAAMLASIGIELGPYDALRDSFPARFDETAGAALREFATDFRVQARAVRRAVEETTFSADHSDPEWLSERRAFLQWRLESMGSRAPAAMTAEMVKIESAMQALKCDVPSTPVMASSTNSPGVVEDGMEP